MNDKTGYEARIDSFLAYWEHLAPTTLATIRDSAHVAAQLTVADIKALIAERDALRAQLDAVREALTKERVILFTRRSGYTVEDYSNPLVPVKAIEAALVEGVSDGQQ